MKQKSITVSNESHGKRRTITVSSADAVIMEEVAHGIRTTAFRYAATIINATDPFGKPKPKGKASNGDEHRASDEQVATIKRLVAD